MGIGMGDQVQADFDKILLDLASASSEWPARYLLTGGRGVGKTTWCSRLAKAAHDRGLAIGGLLSRGIYVNDRRIAIEMVDLGTRSSRRLAKRRSGPEKSESLQKWEFDPDALRWGNEILRQQGKVDLLIVDEIGPLEFIHGEGLQEAFHAIDRGAFRIAVVVVRNSLLDRALKRWPDGRVLQLPGEAGRQSLE
jgi:nucleoside-triphosphatase THEP1